MTEKHWCPSRRAVLAGAGGISLAGFLAACGSETTPQADPEADTGAGPIAATGDIPVGGGKVVGSVLVVQPTSGQFLAYSSACPHQGAVIGAPSGGIITCPLHNSTFKDTDGSRISGPATRGLTPIAVKVDGANVVRS